MCSVLSKPETIHKFLKYLSEKKCKENKSRPGCRRLNFLLSTYAESSRQTIQHQQVISYANLFCTNIFAIVLLILFFKKASFIFFT